MLLAFAFFIKPVAFNFLDSSRVLLYFPLIDKTTEIYLKHYNKDILKENETDLF